MYMQLEFTANLPCVDNRSVVSVINISGCVFKSTSEY